MNSIEIKIPATTSNLGPGYDCLGLALGLYNRARVTWKDEDPLYSACQLGEWAGSLPYESRAAGEAYCFYAQEMKVDLPRPRMEFSGDIPVARGLGSSATCALAGLASASLIHRGSLDRDLLLTLATRLEGHPDNAAPALLGGLVLAKAEEARVIAVRLPFHESLQVLLLIPDFPLSTRDARAVLPARLPHGEAVKQTAAFGFLLQGLAHGREDFLRLGGRDYLHQPYRESLIPAYAQARTLLLNAGCPAVALSGAGPSLAGFMVGSEEEAASALEEMRDRLPPGWRALRLPVNMTGMTWAEETSR